MGILAYFTQKIYLVIAIQIHLSLVHLPIPPILCAQNGWIPKGAERLLHSANVSAKSKRFFQKYLVALKKSNFAGQFAIRSAKARSPIVWPTNGGLGKSISRVLANEWLYRRSPQNLWILSVISSI
jgi:hypothetical protein